MFFMRALKQKRATRPFTISPLYLFIQQLGDNAHTHTHDTTTEPLLQWMYLHLFCVFFFLLSRFSKAENIFVSCQAIYPFCEMIKKTRRKRDREKKIISTTARKMCSTLEPHNESNDYQSICCNNNFCLTKQNEQSRKIHNATATLQFSSVPYSFEFWLASARVKR